MKSLKRKDLLFPELSYQIIGSAFDVSNKLGSGHSEKYYQRALAEALKVNGLRFKEQVFYPLKYNNKIIGKNFIDFLVEECIVVEIKKGNKFSKSHIDQVLQYLKSANLKLAILVNFGSEGVLFKRIINIF